ncbi:MAG TPA: hypothetical protein VGO00_09625 [Kofleriaceae bacterium]|nr:hypothetical protein [Kofleriaceae bacterium]
MIAENSFADLRRLADWLSTIGSSGSSQRPSLSIERVVRRLGTTCVPLLSRALARADAREVVRGALAYVATIDAVAKTRVIDELRELAERASIPDDAKLCAVGLLAELGAKGIARFADPSAIQKRSALALAAQLDSASDLANAADMMVTELAEDDLVQMLEVMVEVAPSAARRLAGELIARLDLVAEIRDRVGGVLDAFADRPADPEPERRPPRPTHASVLVDAAARLVVVATRKVSGERRWRRWAVLIGPSGRIDDCIHETDASTLVDSLCADGYRVGSTDVDHARAVVAAAARLSGDAADHEARLTSSYYTGRDLLDLGDAHRAIGCGHRPRRSATPSSSSPRATSSVHARCSVRATIPPPTPPQPPPLACSRRINPQPPSTGSRARSPSSPTGHSTTGTRRSRFTGPAMRPDASTRCAGSSTRA